MAKPETSQRAISLLPFLQPSGPSPRLILTEGTPDASYPFAMLDDSDPFTRVIAGSFLTDAGSRLKNVFLILQRDMYPLQDTTFSTVTNLEIEAGWLKIPSQAITSNTDYEIISLTADPYDNEKMRIFSPLLFCREQKLFIPLLCPSCARELELCHDDELLAQKGLHHYSTSLRRYLYCPSCSSSGQSEFFFVREREYADPLFLSDCMDLVYRMKLLAEKGIDPSKFPCISCVERETCFGSSNSVRRRLSPFSFFPFHMLMVKAPTLNALDFNALLSGYTSGELAEQLDRRAFPGRVSSLNAIDNTGVVKWTIFPQGDERAFPELLFLKLSLLEEVLGRVTANVSASLQGARVWVYLPKISQNLPMGWNFKLLFIDDLTPDVTAHEIERNSRSILARTGLFFFKILLSSRNISDGRIDEAVSHYLSASTGADEETGSSTLLRLCDPASIFLRSDGYVINQQFGVSWSKACAMGFELLDAARCNNVTKCSAIHTALRNLLEETQLLIFVTGQSKSESAVAGCSSELEKLAIIRRVVTEMIASNRAQIQQKSLIPQHDRYDEVVETVMLRASAAPSEQLHAPSPTADDDATVIIPTEKPVQEKPPALLPAEEEEELMETVILSSRHFSRQAPKEQHFQRLLSESPPAEQQASARPSLVQDDLSETVMISAPSGRHRPVGGK